MICEHCHGTGGYFVTRKGYPLPGETIGQWIPCGACGGTTRGHCCEGAVGGPFEEPSQGASISILIEWIEPTNTSESTKTDR